MRRSLLPSSLPSKAVFFVGFYHLFLSPTTHLPPWDRREKRKRRRPFPRYLSRERHKERERYSVWFPPLLAYRENFIPELRSFFDALQLLRIVLYAKVRRQTPQTRIMVGFWEFFEGQTQLYVRFESTVRWIYCDVVWVPIQTSE